ncbi:MAG: 23S rRNA (guanosine(2251)-2'-O)-methyltransferase RlmB [Deltaproteobacteria bacterium]|nr:23S rRNA (guanosine(2251)-2'-O)-methyltransferase RlmB [Deltaproteobacteria bacterium]MBN2674157.1 23S rRNA (guanosine(2251)-2'-O)-methyltransferase RlmB [Deltaproteobacteria bacterium]
MKRIIAGPNQVEEAIKAGAELHVLYIQSGLAQKTAARLYHLAEKHHVKTQAVDKSSLEILAKGLTHQGVIALCGEFPYTSVDMFLQTIHDALESTVVLLDQIQDPGNLGAIIRSAYSLGADGLFITKNRSAQVTAATVRASVGASELLPIVRIVNLVATIQQLKDAGFQLFGAALDGAESLSDVTFSPKTAIVLGNEGKGIRKLTAENCDFLFRIPMATDFESLNVSAAGAIVLYERFRAQMNRDA